MSEKDCEKDCGEIEDEIIDSLDECGDLLLSCEAEKKECEDCGRSAKRDCLIFIRSVLASLCKIEVARSGGAKRDIEESMYT